MLADYGIVFNRALIERLTQAKQGSREWRPRFKFADGTPLTQEQESRVIATKTWPASYRYGRSTVYLIGNVSSIVTPKALPMVPAKPVVYTPWRGFFSRRSFRGFGDLRQSCDYKGIDYGYFGAVPYQNELNFIESIPVKSAQFDKVDWVKANWSKAYQYTDLQPVMDEFKDKWNAGDVSNESVAAAMWVKIQTTKRDTGSATQAMQQYPTAIGPAMPSSASAPKPSITVIKPTNVPPVPANAPDTFEGVDVKKLAINGAIAVGILGVGYILYSRMYKTA